MLNSDVASAGQRAGATDAAGQQAGSTCLHYTCIHTMITCIHLMRLCMELIDYVGTGITRYLKVLHSLLGSATRLLYGLWFQRTQHG